MKKQTHTASKPQEHFLLDKLWHHCNLTQQDLEKLSKILLGENWEDRLIYQSFESVLTKRSFNEPITYKIYPSEHHLTEIKTLRKPSLIEQSKGTFVYSPEKCTRTGEISLLYLLLINKINGDRKSPSLVINFSNHLRIPDSSDNEELSVEIEEPLYQHLCILRDYISNCICI